MRISGANGSWSSWLGATAAAFALLCLVPVDLVAQDGPPSGREVVELRFEGARAFRIEQLRTAIQTRESGCKLPFPLSVACEIGFGKEHEYLENPFSLELDAYRLRVFYAKRGYRDARVAVDTLRLDRGMRVVFTIDEGRPVRVASLEVEGAAGFLPDSIEAQLPLRLGEPLNELAIGASRDSLTSAMRNRGYPRAETLIDRISIPRDSYEAEVRFVVIPGTGARFGEVEITGDDRISEDVIRRMLTFRKGDPYRHSALLASQSNLFGLNVFQNVSIRPVDDPSADTVIPVRIQVNEGDIHRIRFGLGANNLDCINAEGSWTSSNFLGGARRLEVRGLVANVLASWLHDNAGLCDVQQELDEVYRDLNYSLSTDFSQPWFLGPRNTFGAGLFVERRSLPGVFVRNARGGYLSVTRSISPRTTLSLGFRPELTGLDAAGGDLFFCESFIACAVNQIDVLEDAHWLIPLTLSFARDRTNSAFFPSRGYIFRVETEYASRTFGSEFAYGRGVADLSSYRGLGHGVILASRLRGGWARSIEAPGGAAGLGLNPQKRFFAGGANSARGFAQYRLGPKVLRVDADTLLAVGCTPAQINAGMCDPSALPADYRPPDRDVRPVGGDMVLEGGIELRYPLYGDRWRGAAFVDFGQVWQRAAEERPRLRDIVFTPGLGIRYHSPIGPIRVDVGYNTQGGESLPVITTVIDEATREVTKDLKAQLPYFWDASQRFDGFWDRLQFHFSIGQAF